MNVKMKFIGCATCAALSVATQASVSDDDIIAYFPLDADLRSSVHADKNPTWDERFIPEGGSIGYNSEAARQYVVDKDGRMIREGNKFVTFDKSRVYIPLTSFCTDAGVNQVTFEMFVRGDGRTDSDSKSVKVWEESVWLDKLSTWSWAQNVGPKRSECLVFWMQNGDSTTGETYEQVGQKSVTAHPKVLDGRWNHLAVTIDDKTAKIYLNYEEVSTVALDASWHWSNNSDGSGYFLVLGGGSGTSKLDFDEIRITKGVLPVEDWLRIAGELMPEDGDTLLYLPFDFSLETLAYPLSDAGYTSTGALTYDASVWKKKVVEYGDRQVVIREENVACLKANKSAATRTLPNPYLQRGANGDAMTVEFFMKGSAVAGEMSTWGSKLVVGKYWSDELKQTVYPFLVQANDDFGYYFRFDSTAGKSTSFQPGVSLTDGRWHHFAATFEPVEGGAKTKISFFADYGDAMVQTVEGTWCLTRSSDKSLVLGDANCVVWMDEFRVSNGLLPKSKFLKANNLTGIIMVVR